MPQWRKLHVKATESWDINDMPDDFTRLLWVMLPLALDREGRGQDSASWVKSKVMPLRDDVDNARIWEALGWYTNRGMIVRYQVGGRRYFYVPTWNKYQGSCEKEGESDYPTPPQVQTYSGVGQELVESKSTLDSDVDSDSDNGREKTAPETPAKDFTPQVEIEMLLGARHSSKDAEDDIRRSGWKIQPDEVRWAVACFLSASALPIPFDKPARKDWYATCKAQLETFGLVALQKFYPIAVKQLRDDGMTVARPGALTKTLADLNARTAPPLPPPVPNLNKYAIPAEVRQAEEARLAPH